MHSVDLTEFGVDNTDENKQMFQFYAEKYFSAFTIQLKAIFDTPEVQNATTQAEQNKIISQQMKYFQDEYFYQFFNPFIEETQANSFTFEDILNNALLNAPETQEKLQTDHTYREIQQKNKEKSLAEMMKHFLVEMQIWRDILKMKHFLLCEKRMLVENFDIYLREI